MTGSLRSSVSSAVISAAASALGSRKVSYSPTEKHGVAGSRNSVLLTTPDNTSHITCTLRSGPPQYPLCDNPTVFRERSDTANRIARLWLLLGKPAKPLAGACEQVETFAVACELLAPEEAEHVRCLLLRTSVTDFGELLEFVSPACCCTEYSDLRSCRSEGFIEPPLASCVWQADPHPRLTHKDSTHSATGSINGSIASIHSISTIDSRDVPTKKHKRRATKKLVSGDFIKMRSKVFEPNSSNPVGGSPKSSWKPDLRSSKRPLSASNSLSRKS